MEKTKAVKIKRKQYTSSRRLKNGQKLVKEKLNDDAKSFYAPISTSLNDSLTRPNGQ